MRSVQDMWFTEGAYFSQAAPLRQRGSSNDCSPAKSLRSTGSFLIVGAIGPQRIDRISVPAPRQVKLARRFAR